VNLIALKTGVRFSHPAPVTHHPALRAATPLAVISANQLREN
jgi:hypothetical protein